MGATPDVNDKNDNLVVDDYADGDDCSCLGALYFQVICEGKTGATF